MYSNPTRWWGFSYDAKDNIVNHSNCNDKDGQDEERRLYSTTVSQHLGSELELRNRGGLAWVADRLCCCTGVVIGKLKGHGANRTVYATDGRAAT
jgi:hypothetical protein